MQLEESVAVLPTRSIHHYLCSFIGFKRIDDIYLYRHSIEMAAASPIQPTISIVGNRASPSSGCLTLKTLPPDLMLRIRAVPLEKGDKRESEANEQGVEIMQPMTSVVGQHTGRSL